MTIKDNYKIIEISKDKNGNYLKVEIQLPNGNSVIRWDIDNFTYNQIKEIVSIKYFDSLAIDYRYELAYYITSQQEKLKSAPIHFGYIRCIQGNRAKNVEFICTEKFAGNIEWFRRSVEKKEDIEHLIWEKLS